MTEFQRNTRKHIERLKHTGEPEVLTVNGQAEVVVQSASSYQQLLDDGELARSLRIISQSLDDAKAGRKRPMRQFIETLAAKYGINLIK
ncbi:MAG TPA: type II toxin-antitoxin system Phd/YefM family antitoxin [Tepidisphaeraceae bacterium]|nr:type II toxin-antitoxin system Phd/YefM family antitoxin [Tepidisphaeraceae bacterium]